MEQTVDLNLNNSQCLVTKVQFGHDIVYNICKGTETIVPWGVGDYFMLGFTGLVLAVIVSIFVKVLVAR